MEGRNICDAEREASEVLHSLLSIERVKKPERLTFEPSSLRKDVQWRGTQTDFDKLEVIQKEDDLDWEDPTAVDMDSSDSVPIHTIDPSGDNPSPLPSVNKTKSQVAPKSKKLKKVEVSVKSDDNTPQDVIERFKQGCECSDDSCFRGLSPESVYKHRLNIAELTKEEHDMYLMGVTMACMADPGVTMRRKERQRLRSQYVYHGRKVCLSAFLFLENCTLYQLKRIRKHVMTHGVTPRVHGNHGKKPHNVFSLDTYRRATDFLKSYIEQYTKSSVNLKLPVSLPPDISRKTIHNAYYELMKKSGPPDEKVMGYSTFRHFMKEQFPNVRFCKTELFSSSTGSTSGNSGLKSSQNVTKQSTVVPSKPCQEAVEVGSLVASSHVTSTPVILSDVGKTDIGPTYILTQLQPIQEFTTFQPQTISVAPLPSNTTYAFTTI